MSLKKWIEEEEAPAADRPRIILEDVADNLMLRVTAEISRGGVWKFSPATRAAEEEIHALYLEFVTGNGGGIAALTAAIERWRILGTVGMAIRNGGLFDESA